MEKHEKDLTTHVKTTIVKVPYVTGWQNFQIWLGRILLGIIGIGILFLIIKFGLKRFI